MSLLGIGSSTVVLYASKFRVSFPFFFIFRFHIHLIINNGCQRRKGGGGNDLHRRFDFVSRFWRRSRRSYFVEDLEDGWLRKVAPTGREVKATIHP